MPAGQIRPQGGKGDGPYAPGPSVTEHLVNRKRLLGKGEIKIT